MCNGKGVIYISNGPSFRLGDGEFKKGFYETSGSLNQAGKNNLLRNLQIGSIIRFGGQSKQKHGMMWSNTKAWLQNVQPKRHHNGTVGCIIMHPTFAGTKKELPVISVVAKAISLLSAPLIGLRPMVPTIPIT